jgi:hypothetical protein
VTEKKKWIGGAIKHPGALRKTLGAKGGVTGQRARLAQTLKGFKK